MGLFLVLGVASAIACYGDELESPTDEQAFMGDIELSIECGEEIPDPNVVGGARCELMVGDIDTLKLDLIVDGESLSGLRTRWSPGDSLGMAVVSGDSAFIDTLFAGTGEVDTTLNGFLLQSRLAQVIGQRRGAQFVEFQVEAGFVLEDVIFEPFIVVFTVTERWQAIEAGSDHTCAVTYRDTLNNYAAIAGSPTLRRGGEAFCWGEGVFGTLGNGQFASSLTPSAVSGSLVFDAVSGGDDHTCGRDSEGLLHCWGFNLSGQLGLGHRLEQYVPRLTDLAIPFGPLSAGDEFTCGVLIDRGAQFSVFALCWGRNDLGQLGCGTACTEDILTPDPGRPVVSLIDGVFDAEVISAGAGHACAANIFGVTWCWGSNEFGQLAISGAPDDCGGIPCSRTARRIGSGQQFLTVSAGDDFTCGIEVFTLMPYCWGRNDVGQLGDGSTVDSDVPVPVMGALGATVFLAVAAGSEHACALGANGAAFCWGANDSGQLGDGTTSLSPQAVPVAGGLRFESLSAGSEHTCGVAADSVATILDPSIDVTIELAGGGGVYCWGDNESAQLGDGTTENRSVPVRVTEPPDPVFQ